MITLGWVGTKNGALLARAESNGFDVLLTFDSGLPHQNAIEGREIAVIILQPEGQGLKATGALVPAVYQQLDQIKPGHVIVVENRRPKP